MTRGIEALAVHADLDFDRVASEGYNYAVAEGPTGLVVPAGFAAMIAAIKAAGLLAGVLHRPDPDTNTGALGATAEANALVTAVTGAGGLGASQIPPGIVVTEPIAAGDAALVTWLTTWVAVVEAGLGTSPMICTTPDVWASATLGSLLFSRLPLSLTRYSWSGSHSPTCTGWTAPDLWCWSGQKSRNRKGPRVAGYHVRISEYVGEDFGDLTTPQIRV